MTSVSEYNCVFCKESFENKEELQVHFRKHGDPKFNQNVKSKTEMQSQSNCEEGEVVSCDVCTEIFPTISKAITHKHKFHPDHDAKYFCPWCGKLFTMKHLYNKHIESNHGSNNSCEEKCFHCDYCEVDFFIPSAMLYHNKFFHRQDTELATIGQSRKLKMFEEKALPLYYCPFCGEEYYNKVNLHKHMGDDHSDENQSPDDILRCPLCDAVFYHLDAYEVHLTFHSTEDIYSEENEMVKDATEYSLETVPPVMEKVENDIQNNAEATISSIGIEEFLQQAMNESVDNDSNPVPEKRKKHKKHKKSKKSAITLDEFFNMNKDVFGEGIDFQGVEEVPTQVVAKHLKKPIRAKAGPKVMQSLELQKLKSQGIVVKTKSGKSFNLPNMAANKSMNILKKANANNNMKYISQPNEKIVSSGDILSKLLNQSNSQLKIVKKSTQNLVNEMGKPENENGESANVTESSDVNMNEGERMDLENKSNANNSDTFVDGEQENHQQDVDDNIDNDILDNSDNGPTIETIPNTETGSSSMKDSELYDISNKNNQHRDNPLKNFNQHVTVKSASQKITTKEDNIPDSNIPEPTHEVSSQGKKNFANESINVLKHLSHLTVKSSNQAKRTSPHSENSIAQSKTDSSDSGLTEKFAAPHTTHESDSVPIQNQQTKKESDLLKNKSLETLMGLNKQLTVKSLVHSTNTKNVNDNSSQQTINEKISQDSENQYFDDNFSDEDMETTSNTADKIMNSSNLKSISDIKQVSTKFVNPLEFNKKSPSNSPIPLKYKVMNMQQENSDISSTDNSMKKHCTEILKEFPNITAKTLIEKKSPKQFTLPVKTDKQVLRYTGKRNEGLQKITYIEHQDIETFNIDDSDEEEMDQVVSEKNISKNKTDAESELKNNKNYSTDVLKNLSKHITIKPANKNKAIESPVKVSGVENVRQAGNEYKKDINIDDSEEEEMSEKFGISKNKTTDIESEINSDKNSSTDVLKNLSKHITIKSANNNKAIPNPVKVPSVENVRQTDNECKKDMNIDDSEEDDIDQVLAEKLRIMKNNPRDTESELKNVKNSSANVLKNLSKHVTVKSTNKNKVIESPVKVSGVKNVSESSVKPVSRKDSLLQNTLRNLSKNITVKSNNYFSKSVTVEQSHSTNKSATEDYDSDCNTSPNKVTITEVDNGNLSENDDLNENNFTVQSPDDTNSENEDFKRDSEFTKKKLDIPNLNKQCSQDYSDEEDETDTGFGTKIPNVCNELSIKPYKLNQNGSRVTTNIGKQSTGANKASNSQNQINTINKEVNVKTFQSKTVIEEITTTVTKTIRTVQSNQTVKQEVRNVSQASRNSAIRNVSQAFNNSATLFVKTQASHKSAIRPQRFRGPRPAQHVQNFHGVTVRQAAPLAAPRIRNQIPPFRSAGGVVVRPSNQVMPFRPPSNISRPNIPRTPIIRKPLQKFGPRQPVMGKPLKMSPNAVISQAKVVTPEGPFSCFKKQNESLIPVPDIPTFDDNEDGGSTQFASSSQVTKSDFTTKITKDNSLISAKQTKSCASEHISKISNMSGLKVTKNIQTKQITQVEKSEVSASKRTALEAIAKLQKQGLLVKKPRQDQEIFSDRSHSGEDDDNLS